MILSNFDEFILVNDSLARKNNNFSMRQRPTQSDCLKATITLNDGVRIPQIGLGTFDYKLSFHDGSPEEDTQSLLEFKNAVYHAIKHTGYRHIDAAEFYRTHAVIGEVIQQLIKEGVISRRDMFITSKVNDPVRTKKGVIESVKQTLSDLKTDYIDLYLVHSPNTSFKEGSGKRGEDVLEVYQQLMELKQMGKIRSVGVSNFNIPHLRALEEAGLAPPSVNQIEAHCFLFEKALIGYCTKKRIYIEAYCPIARAHEKVRNDGTLQRLARSIGNGKTWAHIMIRWCLQQGFIVLPKSVRPERIDANADVFDFELSEQDMNDLEALRSAELRVSWNPLQVVWDVCHSISSKL